MLVSAALPDIICGCLGWSLESLLIVVMAAVVAIVSGIVAQASAQLFGYM